MKTVEFKIPNIEGEFVVIEKRGYTGKGYRYSLKCYDEDLVEYYYCDSIKNSKTQIKESKLIELAIKHMNDMEILSLGGM